MQHCEISLPINVDNCDCNSEAHQGLNAQISELVDSNIEVVIEYGVNPERTETKVTKERTPVSFFPCRMPCRMEGACINNRPCVPSPNLRAFLGLRREK